MDFPIDVVLRRIGWRFDAAATDRGLDLRVVASRLTVRSDPPLLAEITDHLAANAIRFTAAGRVLVGCRRQGRTASLEIWDSGPGLADDQCQALLGAPSDAAARPHPPANLDGGIGLTVVRHLARLLHHPLEVEAWPGRGTRIALRLPLADPPQGEKPANEKDRPRMVVVIDDEAQVLEGLRLLLEAWDFRVVAAPSEAEAIAQLQKFEVRPDGIIADYRLREGRTGTEAVHHIRDLYHWVIPSIIITGDSGATRREAEATGCVVLQKPVAARHLHNILSLALKGL